MLLDFVLAFTGLAAGVMVLLLRARGWTLGLTVAGFGAVLAA